MSYVDAVVHEHEGHFAIRCDTCRIIYGNLDDLSLATELAKSHVHRVNLSRDEVGKQRAEANKFLR